MKKILLTLSVLVALSACGGQAEEQPASAQPQEQAQSELKTMPVSYTDYQSAANKGLADQKTGLTLPEHVSPTDNAEGKNLLHDFSDGLTLTVDTDKADKITAVRVVWNTDAVPQKAEKLSKAASALIAATAPEDRTLPATKSKWRLTAIMRKKTQPKNGCVVGLLIKSLLPIYRAWF